MKIILLGLLLAPIIYMAFKKKKWYLYLPVAMIGFLPEQFAFELHESLPMISGSRVLILIMMGFWFWERWKERRLSIPLSLTLFLGINIIVSLVNLRYGYGEINRIFIFVFERVLLAVMVKDLVKNKEEFIHCVDFMIMGSTAVFLIGIVQTVFEYDISSVLHLTETLASTTLAPRMGLSRAFGTYNAISFGCYCVLMAVPILYRLYNTKKWQYSIAFALDVIALICSLTRSAWLCLAAIVVVMGVLTRKKFLYRLLPAAGATILLFGVLCLFQPNLANALIETGKSSVNAVIEILPDSVVSIMISDTETNDGEQNLDKPSKDDLKLDVSEDFGMNAEDPTYSRMAQWSAVEYMVLQRNALFGQGYNALPEGRIHFFFDRWGAKWEPTDFLDVGLVALLVEGGFVGALSFMALLAYMFIYSLRKRNKADAFDFFRATEFTVMVFLLLNFVAAFMFEDVVWVFIALFYAYKGLENHGGLKDNGECLQKSSNALLDGGE